MKIAALKIRGAKRADLGHEVRNQIEMPFPIACQRGPLACNGNNLFVLAGFGTMDLCSGNPKHQNAKKLQRGSLSVEARL